MHNSKEPMSGLSFKDTLMSIGQIKDKFRDEMLPEIEVTDEDVHLLMEQDIPTIEFSDRVQSLMV